MRFFGCIKEKIKYNKKADKIQLQIVTAGCPLPKGNELLPAANERRAL